MAFDGFVVRALVHELSQAIIGGKIAKVYQPFPDDLLLIIRNQGQNYRLLFSANPTYPRFHLSTVEEENPKEAPMFCMLIRKHCEGGTIKSIEQVGMERVIHIDIQTRDELGDEQTRRMIFELMGRHSNLVLLDLKTEMILDSIRHVTPAISQYRVVLPGRPYVTPPVQEKTNPLHATKEEFISKIQWNTGRIDRQMVEQYLGLSPLLAKAILHQAGLANHESLWNSFSQVMDWAKQHHYTPQIVHTAEKSYFSVFPIPHLDGEQINFATVSQCLESYFHGKAQRDAIKQKAHDLLRFVKNERDKNEKKIVKLEAGKLEAENAQIYQLYGELLTAYLHEIQKGQSEVHLINYYDPDQATLTIPLQPNKTPAENAQIYFKQYNKAKKNLQLVDAQIADAQEEINYFDTLQQQIEVGGLSDIQQIREELEEGGYLRSHQKMKRKRKPEQPLPHTYISSTGIPIAVGKNNKQNDYLTIKLAKASHWWLHTKEIPGSHVVIQAEDPDETTIQEAAMLAAYFSKAQLSSKVPVDYTQVRNVKKPRGAKPGFVIYEKQSTIYVTPDEGKIQQMNKRSPR